MRVLHSNEFRAQCQAMKWEAQSRLTRMVLFGQNSFEYVCAVDMDADKRVTRASKD